MLGSVTIKRKSNERIPLQHYTMHFNYQSLLIFFNFLHHSILKPIGACYLCNPLVVVLQGPKVLYLEMNAKPCVACETMKCFNQEIFTIQVSGSLVLHFLKTRLNKYLMPSLKYFYLFTFCLHGTELCDLMSLTMRLVQCLSPLQEKMIFFSKLSKLICTHIMRSVPSMLFPI
jgi:hypothetical protein